MGRHTSRIQTESGIEKPTNSSRSILLLVKEEIVSEQIHVDIGPDHSEVPSSYHIDPKAKDIREEMKTNELWYRIRLAAKTNPALQEALDRTIVLYHLINENK